MTDREKKLAIVVGVLAVTVVGYLVYSAWSSRIETLKTSAFNLSNTISDQDTEIIKGDRAFQTIKDFRRRSLPANAEVARSQYKAWLLDLAEKQIKFDEPVVAPGTITRGGTISRGVDVPYKRLTLTVSGKGTLQQLTEFLHAFYGTDLTHQIRSMDIKPIDESRQLEIFLGVEALVVDKADSVDTLSPQPSSLADEKPLDTYLAAILNRNLFGPANRPPEIDSIRSQRSHVGETVSVSLEAEDEDPLDKITFRLADGSPEGASLSGDKLRFRSGEVGEYEITVIATDDGLPPKSAQTTFSVKVSEKPAVAVRPDPPAPKPKPYFEDAEFAFVTAIIEVNGQRELWLNVRTSGETMKLSEGDRFTVKRMKGIVSRIGEKDVDVTAAGESRRFGLGENLAQGERLPAAASASGDGE